MSGGEVEDPGPPPRTGLVVRPEGEGFYARINPRPAIPWARWVAGWVAFLALGAGLAAMITTDVWLAAEIVVSIGLFAGLLFAFGHGKGYIPVEIVVDDERVTWGGERYPIATVADCRVEERALVLVGQDGRALARVDGVEPEAARWVSLAVRASLPR
ncbi:MAG: hypothetical protein R3F59_19380 [Myxococcota bacterium]